VEPMSGESVSRVIDAGPRGFVFRFPYKAALVEAVKTIEGRRYDPVSKTWTIPCVRVYARATRVRAPEAVKSLRECLWVLALRWVATG